MPTTSNDKLADAALKLLAKTPWRDMVLADVAKAAKVPLTQLQDLRGGKPALIGLILKKIGAETAKHYRAESDTARARLFDVALAWFEVNARRKPAIRSLYEGLKFDPVTLISERNEFLAAAQWLMTLAKADTGPAVPARAAGLALIIARAMAVWLDDDADMTATMARLDQDLSRAGGFASKSPSP